jgi:hypothetical protein
MREANRPGAIGLTRARRFRNTALHPLPCYLRFTVIAHV